MPQSAARRQLPLHPQASRADREIASREARPFDTNAAAMVRCRAAAVPAADGGGQRRRDPVPSGAIVLPVHERGSTSCRTSSGSVRPEPRYRRNVIRYDGEKE